MRKRIDSRRPLKGDAIRRLRAAMSAFIDYEAAIRDILRERRSLCGSPGLDDAFDAVRWLEDEYEEKRRPS